LRFRQALLEGFLPLREIGGITRAESGQLLLYPLGDAQAVVGIEPVMGVALRVDVAHRARQLSGGDLEDLDPLRGVEVALAPRLDLGVAGLVHERGKPAYFKLASDRDQEVGGVEL